MIKDKVLNRPMKLAQVRKLKAVLPRGVPPKELSTRIESSVFSLDKGKVPSVSTRLQQVASGRDWTTWRLDVEVEGQPKPAVKPAVRAELRCVKRTELSRIKDKDSLSLKPFQPEFLGKKFIPSRSRMPRANRILTRQGKSINPLYIFDPDDRYIYRDENYPWRCAGQVVSKGISTGVLVGPRHVLTASHSLDWVNPWATFYANQWGKINQGVAHTWCVWYYEKIGDGLSENIESDYVVCVLDTPLGSWLGWMGSRTYNDDWDSEPYWAHVGYASDIHDAHYPTYQDGVVLEEEDGGSMKVMSSTTADLTAAHSGGPVFGWWDGGPYVVGVVSGEARNKNWMSGGTAMVKLIKSAHAETP